MQGLTLAEWALALVTGIIVIPLLVVAAYCACVVLMVLMGG